MTDPSTHTSIPARRHRAPRRASGPRRTPALRCLVPVRSPRQRLPHLRQRFLRRAEHELRVRPEHTPPEPREPAVLARIPRPLPRVARPVDFDDEPRRGHREVGDKAAEHDLPLGGRAELPARKQAPERSLERGRRAPLRRWAALRESRWAAIRARRW